MYVWYITVSAFLGISLSLSLSLSLLFFMVVVVVVSFLFFFYVFTQSSSCKRKKRGGKSMNFHILANKNTEKQFMVCAYLHVRTYKATCIGRKDLYHV